MDERPFLSVNLNGQRWWRLLWAAKARYRTKGDRVFSLSPVPPKRRGTWPF